MTSETPGHDSSHANNATLKAKYATRMPATMSRTRRIVPATAETHSKYGLMTPSLLWNAAYAASGTARARASAWPN
jgi:hypothetical protein